MNRLVLIAVLSLALSACAQPTKPTPPPPFDMSWMKVGITERSEVIERLGQPASYLEGGKAIFYRLVNEKVDREIAVANTRDSIVIIFNDEGSLVSKRRVKR